MKSKFFIRLALLVMMAAGLFWNEDREAQAGSLSTRGVWVSCFEYDSVGLAGKTESEFRANADTLFSNIEKCGCNAVYFHVRSYDDAIYPSEIVGWSKRLTLGEGAPDYDPLEILVDSAHSHGLKFHAWMNPYRVTQKKVLDPGDEATVQRIVSQVKEIVNGYKVDGIHFDDYFYPSNQKKYNTIGQAERMENVNDMVKRVYKAVKKKKRSIQFGISPAGDVSYCEKIGADVKTWMSEDGYIDYIAPQIYWSDNYIMEGKKTKLFKERLSLWRSLNTNDIPMYIGLAAYKAGSSLKEDPGWKKSSNNLKKQLSQIRNGNSEGYILFSYTDLYRDTAAKEIKKMIADIGTMQISSKNIKLHVGSTYELSVTSAWPSRIRSGLKWESSNRSVASVTPGGKIRAKKKGTVRITVYYGFLKKTCKVKVLK